MNCQQFADMLEDLERELPMKETTRAAALAHAEDCAGCRKRLVQARLLSLELRALAKEDESLCAPVYLETRLAAAFRQHKERSSMAWKPWVWAAAAAVVAIGWLIARPSRQAVSTAVMGKIAHATSPSKPTAAAPQLAAKNDDVPARTHVSRKPVETRRRMSRENQTEADATNEFVSFPYSDTAYPVGDGMMVRVQLPRMAPAMIGLPVAPGSDTSGTVTADVVIGQDGVARAIRFVSPGEGEFRGRNVNFNKGNDEGEPQ